MPPFVSRAIAWWRDQPLVRRFLLADALIMVIAALVVGFWLTSRIEQSVLENTAAATSLYMESFVEPISHELDGDAELSPGATAHLNAILAETPLGERIASIKIWKENGLVAHASDPALIGRSFEETEELRGAWAGRVTSTFEELDDDESAAEKALGLPLYEVYAPIRRAGTGIVIAVAEFYAHADQLQADLASARQQTWAIVAAVFATCGFLLLGIVQAAGRTIDRQRALLEETVAQTRAVARQNRDLRERAVGAAARAAAHAEKTLRTVGSDLHDGPAQHLATAAMRMDRIRPETDAGRSEAEAARTAITEALTEIRRLSRGLVLPDLEGMDLREVVGRAADLFSEQSGHTVPVTDNALRQSPRLDQSRRLCIYRFLQEALSNANRHAGGAGIGITIEATRAEIRVTVTDTGPGFDPEAAVPQGSDRGQGLAGLRDRAESIGGEIRLQTAPGAGTTLTLMLPNIEESGT